MKKTAASLAAALALVLLCLAPAARADYDHFDDVNARAWYADAVNWAVLSGVTNGTSPTEFSPNLICTRGQIAALLWRANGCPSPAKARNPFADVPTGSYYEKAILWAVENGVVKGVSATAFAPEEKCTCGQILTLIWRSEGCPEPEAPSGTTEGWPAGDEKDAAAWAESVGMLEGTDVPAEAFDPAAPCSRGLAVKYLHDAAYRFVTTADQLVGALAPCRIICLAPGTYDLTEWMENSSAAARAANPYARVEEVYDGLELQIVGLEHVTFRSPTHDPADTRIVVSPRYANVLSFINCSDIRLNDLTLGHTSEQGYCTGGVIYLEDCGSVFLKNLDLYGCGTYGITAFDTGTIYAADVTIRDCTYGGLELYRVSSASFTDCVVKNCQEFDILTIFESSARFSRCAFTDNLWLGEFSDFLSLTDSTLEFDWCTFDQAAYRSVVDHRANGEAIRMTGEIVN